MRRQRAHAPAMASSSNIQTAKMDSAGYMDDCLGDCMDDYDDECEAEYDQPNNQKMMINEEKESIAERLQQLIRPDNADATTQKIMSLQQITGNWLFDQSLLQAMKASQLYESLKDKLGNQDELMTVIVVAWLEKFADKNVVSMIINKGTGYLRKANVPEYKTLIEEAKLHL